MTSKLIATATALVLMPASGALGGGTELVFFDHIKAEMIEQDVYVPRGDDGKVFRVTKEDYSDYMDEMVYRTAVPVEHAPMDMAKVGPYDAGQPLDFTLGSWLSATGEASYDCREGKGEFSAKFDNLVPNGLYTMWIFFAGQSMAEFRTFDLPMGAPDGSESSFTADPKGHAEYGISLEACLQGTGPQLLAGLAIAYHSDDATHGYEPGPMGNKSHIHLFTVLPSDSELNGQRNIVAPARRGHKLHYMRPTRRATFIARFEFLSLGSFLFPRLFEI
ncbi:MAG: hypothetical protein ACR2O1_09740 [Boseongicola sp.]